MPLRVIKSKRNEHGATKYRKGRHQFICNGVINALHTYAISTQEIVHIYLRADTKRLRKCIGTCNVSEWMNEMQSQGLTLVCFVCLLYLKISLFSLNHCSLITQRNETCILCYVTSDDDAVRNFLDKKSSLNQAKCWY